MPAPRANRKWVCDLLDENTGLKRRITLLRCALRRIRNPDVDDQIPITEEERTRYQGCTHLCARFVARDALEADERG